MTATPWTPLFEKTLRTALSLLDEGAELPPTARLADLGLDSLSTVNLLIELEEQLEIMIPDELLTMTTFATAADLWAVVEPLTAEPSS